ncbi:MAG: glycosyltransferase, partial [Gemmatimonadota bacterium]
LAEIGAAPPPIPKRKLTADRLASAIELATSRPDLDARAEALGAAIRAEDGAARAADRVLHHLARFPR